MPSFAAISTTRAPFGASRKAAVPIASARVAPSFAQDAWKAASVCSISASFASLILPWRERSSPTPSVFFSKLRWR